MASEKQIRKPQSDVRENVSRVPQCRRITCSALAIARAAVTNNSSLPAKCTYTATKTDGVGPQEVDRSIVVGVKGTTTINDMLWPPLFTSYNAVVKCTATYNGTQTSIGEASQKVTG